MVSVSIASSLFMSVSIATTFYVNEPDAVAELARALASRMEGWEFESLLSQTMDLPNLYSSLTSLARGIMRITEQLVRSVSR